MEIGDRYNEEVLLPHVHIVRLVILFVPWTKRKHTMSMHIPVARLSGQRGYSTPRLAITFPGPESH